MPEPLMLIRHAGHGGWDDTAAAVLGLTKVNWNNDALYDRLPVTLGFAGALAKTIRAHAAARCPPVPVRFFM